MFDFFRDVALEMMGKNSVEEEKKRKEKRKQERKKYYISKSTKTVIFVLGILYLVMGGMSLFASRQIANSMIGVSANISIFRYVKYAFLSVIDIAAMICLLTGKKKMEIAALVLVIIFMVLMYMSSMMVPLF